MNPSAIEESTNTQQQVTQAENIDTQFNLIRLYPENPTKEQLKDYLKLVFEKEGISDQLARAEQVITCESGWNVFADNGISYGIAQFTPDTWNDYGYGDIMDPYKQIEMMAKMWKNNLQSRWDCFKVIK